MMQQMCSISGIVAKLQKAYLLFLQFSNILIWQMSWFYKFYFYKKKLASPLASKAWKSNKKRHTRPDHLIVNSYWHCRGNIKWNAFLENHGNHFAKLKQNIWICKKKRNHISKNGIDFRILLVKHDLRNFLFMF